MDTGTINQKIEMADQKFNVLVIGGGITGSLIAAKLSEMKSLAVGVIEAGSDRTTERIEMTLRYAESKNKSPGSPYKGSLNSIPFPDSTKPVASDYYRYEDQLSEFKSTYVKIGGGSTWHWLGNVPRFLPNDFKMADHYQKGFNWPIDYSELEKYYCEAEHEIGVSGNHEEWKEIVRGAIRSKEFPMPEIWPAYSDTKIKEWIGDFSIDGTPVIIRSTPQARNSQTFQGRPPCAGNSSCVPICPIQAKYDASIHLSKAKNNGVSILFNSKVFKIDIGSNGLVSQIHYKDHDNMVKTAEADIFILAIHAIESAVLLKSSGVSNFSGMVGKFLMDHPQGYGVGLSKEPLYPFRGPPTTSGIDAFRDGDFRKQHAAFRISIGNDGWGRWNGVDKLEDIVHQNTLLDGNFLIGKKLRKSVEDIATRIFRFSYSTEMLPIETNCVEPHPTDIDEKTGLPFPKIKFRTDDSHEYNKKAFVVAANVLTKLFTKIGINENDFQVNSDITKFSGAGHIMGTTKMGFNKKDSVVDKNCNSHEHENLFIVGPGVFPTSGTANPTLTAAALSLRLADYLKMKLINEKRLL